MLLAFIPFVWGLGVANAGFILTFRRGAGVLVTAIALLALLSGAFFPLDLFPAGARRRSTTRSRSRSRGCASRSSAAPVGATRCRAAAVLLPMSCASLVVGWALFRLALRRERRLGTVGLY